MNKQNIKNYTLENSAAAQENFIVGSLQLDALRLERREAEEFLSVLKTIREAYQDKRSHEEIIAKLSGKRLPRRKKEEAVQAPVKKAATRRKKAPVVPAPAPAANLNHEETIMKGYEDQQTDQGLW